MSKKCGSYPKNPIHDHASGLTFKILLYGPKPTRHLLLRCCKNFYVSLYPLYAPPSGNADKFKGGKLQAPKNLKKPDFFVFSGAHNCPPLNFSAFLRALL